MLSPDSSLGLLTDLYQLTMPCAYWKSCTANKDAVFHLSFRTPPFQSGFTIACGLAQAIDHLQKLRFTDSDLDYLATILGRDHKPLFDPGFLECLRKFAFSCDVDAIPEGTVVFPHEPLLRVQGPIVQGQLIEPPLLNSFTFHSLIATKPPRASLPAPRASLLQ